MIRSIIWTNTIYLIFIIVWFFILKNTNLWKFIIESKNIIFPYMSIKTKPKPEQYFDWKYLDIAHSIQKNNISDIDAFAKDVDLDQFGRENMSLLTRAIINDKEKSVRELLTLGANPNLKDSNGMQPIGLAASISDNNKYLKILLEYKWDPNGSFNEYKYALHKSNMKRYRDNVDILLDHGANINLANYSGSNHESILIDNIILKDYDRAIYLINRGADIHLNNDEIASYIQEDEVTSPELFKKQIEIKKILMQNGVVFPRVRKYEEKYQPLRKIRYASAEGKIWENKILDLGRSPTWIGKIWVEIKRLENQAFKLWIKDNWYSETQKQIEQEIMNEQ